VAYIEAMPAGPQRDQDAMMVAIGYAVADPAAATAWVERMLPASPNARMLIAIGLMQQDPVQALDMISSGPATQENQMLLGLIVQAAAQDPNLVQPLAETLAARDDPQSGSLLSNLMTSWVTTDADGALSWMLESDAEFDPAVVGNAAARLAQRDPATAVSYLERMPPQYRDVWITRTAGPYGRSDLDAAVNWVGQYRGQPVFEQAYTQLVSQAAQADPQAAAQLLSQESVQMQRSAAGPVATNWARQDADAAARWAVALNDANAREQGITNVVRVVARQQSAEEARALLMARVSDVELRARVEEQAGLGEAR
jgi:hypothetical protein